MSTPTDRTLRLLLALLWFWFAGLLAAHLLGVEADALLVAVLCWPLAVLPVLGWRTRTREER